HLKGDAEWERLRKEFNWQWPDVRCPGEKVGRTLDDLITAARNLSLPLPQGNRPPIWLVGLFPGTTPTPGAWPPDAYPCGIILVWEPDQSQDYELVVWLRGAYRNLGIGRKCMEQVLDPITAGLRSHPSGRKYLRVRLPGAARPGRGDRLQK